MEIRKIREAEMATALQLIWETFLQFEAPDYSQPVSYTHLVVTPSIPKVL